MCFLAWAHAVCLLKNPSVQSKVRLSKCSIPVFFNANYRRLLAEEVIPGIEMPEAARQPLCVLQRII